MVDGRDLAALRRILDSTSGADSGALIRGHSTDVAQTVSPVANHRSGRASTPPDDA